MQGGVQLASGMVGNAFEFNRQSVIEVPFTPDLVPSAGLSIEGWVRPVGPQVTWARIVGVQTDFSTSAAWVFGISSHGGVYFGAFRNASQSYIDGTTPLADATWTHIAGTWDGVLMRAYINGVLQPDVAANTGPLTGTTVPLLIGRGSGSLLGFNGRVDELTVYQRGLAAAEVATIFAAGPNGKCK